MEISITVACYKAAKEELADYLPTLFTGKKKPSDLLSLPLFDMDLDSLVTLTKHLKSHKDEAYPKVAKLCRSLKDPKNKRVESVEELGKMLKQFLKEQEYKTLHSLHATLRGVAYLPIEVTFYPRIVETRRDNGRDPYVIMTMCYNSRHGFKKDTIRFSEGDDYGTIPEILRRKNLMTPDETMVEEYEKIKKRYYKFSDMHGEMFECKGAGHQTGGRSYWWSEQEVDMTVFGQPSKAVLDTEFGVNKYERDYAKNVIFSTVHDETLAVPIHPVLPMFSLVSHSYVWVNVSNMKVYEYDDKVQDRLILPAAQRRLIQALVSNLDALRDESEGPDKSKILKSKAQSSVILCYGPPGTGKTLTAEVYAETIQRPCYEVQCAQIGSDPETIESSLREVLARSLRLKMPLLINEADAFVGKRGRSLEQDAVVAVFLRLLEYHTGLVFLTTNREQDIDDAIKSRCIALIEYKIPEFKERRRLWQVQLEQFGLELTPADLMKAARGFPTIVGRDIQNLIKLTSRVCKALNTKFCFEELRYNATFRGIKVLTDEEIAEVKAKAAASKEATEAK